MPVKPRVNSTKVEVPLNIRVTVRVRPDFRLTEQALEKLNTIYNSALARLERTMIELSDFIEACIISDVPVTSSSRFNIIITTLHKHFRISPTTSNKALIDILHLLQSKLRNTYDGLFSEKEPLFISNTSKTRTGHARGYVHRKSKPDSIYLDFNLLTDANETTETIAKTLIHEATHLFCNAHDYAYYSDQKNTLSNKHLNHLLFKPDEHFLLTCLTQKERLNNADSLAHFVMHLSSQLMLDEELNQVHPARTRIKIETLDTLFAKKPSNMYKFFACSTIAATLVKSATLLLTTKPQQFAAYSPANG